MKFEAVVMWLPYFTSPIGALVPYFTSSVGVEGFYDVEKHFLVMYILLKSLFNVYILHHLLKML